MINLTKQSKKEFINLYKTKSIGIEGNILKLINVEGDEEFKKYVDKCLEDDKNTRKIRLEITKEIQRKNKELTQLNLENERILDELKNQVEETKIAKIEAESAKEIAESDLDLLQKKTQNELISIIVKVALWVIIGVGITTTAIYIFTILMGKDTQIISSAWANIIGILLTNAFSIIGTIMGIKYASKQD